MSYSQTDPPAAFKRPFTLPARSGASQSGNVNNLINDRVESAYFASNASNSNKRLKTSASASPHVGTSVAGLVYNDGDTTGYEDDGSELAFGSVPRTKHTYTPLAVKSTNAANAPGSQGAERYFEVSFEKTTNELYSVVFTRFNGR